MLDPRLPGRRLGSSGAGGVAREGRLVLLQREGELRSLIEAFDQARGGPGTTVLLSGEAGSARRAYCASSPPGLGAPRDGETYVVDHTTNEYEAVLPGQHVHVFFDTVPPEEAGVPGNGPGIVYGGPSPFTEYTTADPPAEATQMCSLVANEDHSVIPDSGTCHDLP